ncbi:disintegrin and metalloproteinase domain-containing protein 10-like isoform X3 [Ruditapes philippinarum]|uniref:disintegrin and metalloproteinase domain-containing protein 10-like isoform X3 n=1 Tax=Ruditapes philippinarum TaxID=129788 RepID=UPI00295AAF29|nr:disintegrin and metalloproteinase domain-containing protein 10-like isoform X3 [Ruditapes philippinarum]
MRSFIVFTLIILEIIAYINTLSADNELLDKRLLYYEPLHYDIDDLHLRHSQVGKSGDLLRVNFYAFNRNFSLELRRKGQSNSNIILHHKKEITTPDLSFVYTGKDTDHSGSEASLAVINGTLQGKIILPGETIYHVVPSSWLFKSVPYFHTVIYSEKDYIWNHTYHSDTSIPFGGSSQSQDMYKKPRGRRKRDLIPPSQGQDHHVCTVKLTTDKTVWKYFMSLDQSEDRSRYDILYMLENHVTEANKIFKNTEFTLNQGKKTEENLKGIQFEIRKIKIMTDIDCEDEGKSVLCNEDLDGQSLLYQFSDEEHDIFYYDNVPEADNIGGDDYTYSYAYPEEEIEYCLSFLITARVLYVNKESPLLGLAFSALDDGGICSSQNNGFITLFQERTQALPALVTQLVFTHEVAHGFGALHDDMKQCSEYNLKEEPADGYYLMHKIAQRGDKPNHYKLSQCSLKYISETLSRKKSRICFTDSELPYCGNGIVDDGEECDCGNDCETDLDNCCHSNNATGGLRCTLKDGAKCSPSQGPCCDSNFCQFINRTQNFVCQNPKPCVDELFCHGEIYGAQCPPPNKHQQREDGFICSGNGRVCDAGSCNASICKLIQWRECQMSNNNDKLTIQEKEDLCYIGCRKKKSYECISSHDRSKVKQHIEFMNLLSNISTDNTILPVQLPPGTPCNKNRGYCDVFNRCRGANPDTPLARLRQCFASGECGEHILYILRVYWWAVILCSIAGLVLFWLFVKCCAVHTKSSNPEVELRHPHRSVRQSVTSVRDSVVHPQKTFRASVRSVRGSLRSFSGTMRNARDSFRRMNSRPVTSDFDLKKIEEELEVLNKNPSTNVEDVFL